MKERVKKGREKRGIIVGKLLTIHLASITKQCKNAI
jgi:hypothetical protein